MGRQRVENLSAHLSPDTVDVDGKSNHIKGTVSIMHDKYVQFVLSLHVKIRQQGACKNLNKVRVEG